jgi:hypothetical protein
MKKALELAGRGKRKHCENHCSRQAMQKRRDEERTRGRGGGFLKKALKIGNDIRSHLFNLRMDRQPDSFIGGDEIT